HLRQGLALGVAAQLGALRQKHCVGADRADGLLQVVGDRPRELLEFGVGLRQRVGRRSEGPKSLHALQVQAAPSPSRRADSEMPGVSASVVTRSRTRSGPDWSKMMQAPS